MMDPAYLPTSRRDFIMNHPETYMANLHASSTNGSNIAPTWTKVTTTAYAGKALICNGYGKRLQNTAVSDDAPGYFLNPDRVVQPKNRMTQEEARVTKILKSDSSYVLPGGNSMRVALANPPADSHKRFRSFPHDSFRIKPQMFIEPLITTRPGETLSKNPITQSTEGHYQTMGFVSGPRVPLSTWAKESGSGTMSGRLTQKVQ